MVRKAPPLAHEDELIGIIVRRKVCDVVVVVGDLVPVLVMGMNDVGNSLMCVAMLFDIRLVGSNDGSQFEHIVRNNTRRGRQRNATHQHDNEPELELFECPNDHAPHFATTRSN
ncbi:wingless-like protein [Ahrensia sp. R2A130]|nr:wingless-like protein [Ahrensia sp. R2A130]